MTGEQVSENTGCYPEKPNKLCFIAGYLIERQPLCVYYPAD